MVFGDARGKEKKLTADWQMVTTDKHEWECKVGSDNGAEVKLDEGKWVEVFLSMARLHVLWKDSGRGDDSHM